MARLQLSKRIRTASKTGYSKSIKIAQLSRKLSCIACLLSVSKAAHLDEGMWARSVVLCQISLYCIKAVFCGISCASSRTNTVGSAVADFFRWCYPASWGAISPCSSVPALFILVPGSRICLTTLSHHRSWWLSLATELPLQFGMDYRCKATVHDTALILS